MGKEDGTPTPEGELAPAIDQVISQTVERFGIPREEILGRGRRPRALSARRFLMATLTAEPDLHTNTIAAALGRDRTTIVTVPTRITDPEAIPVPIPLDIALESLKAAIAEYYPDLTWEEITGRRRSRGGEAGKDLVSPRLFAMRFLERSGATPGETATLLNRDRSTVAEHLAKIKNLEEMITERRRVLRSLTPPTPPPPVVIDLGREKRQRKEIKARAIQEAFRIVIEWNGVTHEELTGPVRKKPYMNARKELTYLLFESGNDFTWREIGSLLGRHRATTYHYYQDITAVAEVSPELTRRLLKLKKAFDESMKAS